MIIQVRHQSKPASPRYGIARVLSKVGLCSRSIAAKWVREGRVQVNGKYVHDPEYPIDPQHDQIIVDGQQLLQAPPRIYLMLNKPRGVVTTANDEQGRDTVYRCFDGATLPWIAPVGRLDKASEGLLLFSNDPSWAASITDPANGHDKTYHVQINCIPDSIIIDQLIEGIDDNGQWLHATSVKMLRHGEKNAWLEIGLNEGKNRQIRRLLAAFDIEVLRLIRVAIGQLELGDLGKSQWRFLSDAEVRSLGVDS